MKTKKYWRDRNFNADCRCRRIDFSHLKLNVEEIKIICVKIDNQIVDPNIPGNTKIDIIPIYMYTISQVHFLYIQNDIILNNCYKGIQIGRMLNCRTAGS